MNERLIKDLRKGKCAVENNGTLDELKAVLKYAFPKNYTLPSGDTKYYLALNPNQWIGTSTHELTSYSVKDFLKSDLQRGDIVYVSDVSEEDAIESKHEKIFIAYIDGSMYQYICVSDDYVNEFNEGAEFFTSNWKYAVKKPVTKMTIEEVRELTGIEDLVII